MTPVARGGGIPHRRRNAGSRIRPPGIETGRDILYLQARLELTPALTHFRTPAPRFHSPDRGGATDSISRAITWSGEIPSASA
jgi:hypothetical protein